MHFKKRRILAICHEHKTFLKSINDFHREKSSTETTPISSQSSVYVPSGSKISHAKIESTVSKEVADAITNLAKAAGE